MINFTAACHYSLCATLTRIIHCRRTKKTNVLAKTNCFRQRVRMPLLQKKQCEGPCDDSCFEATNSNAFIRIKISRQTTANVCLKSTRTLHSTVHIIQSMACATHANICNSLRLFDFAAKELRICSTVSCYWLNWQKGCKIFQWSHHSSSKHYIKLDLRNNRLHQDCEVFSLAEVFFNC